MKLFGSPTSIWIVIPTYWGDADSGIYDHPTPLDEDGTLAFLLESLCEQDSPPSFSALILVSTTKAEYASQATARVQQIIAPYIQKLNLHIADIKTAQFLDQELQTHEIDLQIASMRGYAAVRNLQLLIPAAMGAEVIIAIDDDEVLPKNYLQQATKRIGKDFEGEKITGIAGPYLSEEGSPYISEAEKVSNILVDKSVFMNETMRQLMAYPDELKKTPMALGGNMIFHRDLFTQVGFDPDITRGEDIDYLINACIEGQSFYFDPKLTITHLPPRHFEAPQYAKMRQDVIRFIYEREKLSSHNLSPGDFLLYPGHLLNEDFISAALEALRTVATPEIIKKFGAPKEIIVLAQDYAKKRVRKYETFSTNWRKAVQALGIQKISDKLCQLILQEKNIYFR
ncbi:MAG: glycosyltransferase [Anaerolineae bacterium]|jgi:GT2 family glycosyltransferase|nr:glycosyltransferase [Anaerolineae bacterium]